MSTASQVRDPCGLLRWTRHDLQRGTGLPFHVTDGILAADGGMDATLARDMVVREASRRAGVDVIAENAGVRLRRGEV